MYKPQQIMACVILLSLSFEIPWYSEGVQDTPKTTEKDISLVNYLDIVFKFLGSLQTFFSVQLAQRFQDLSEAGGYTQVWRRSSWSFPADRSCILS